MNQLDETKALGILISGIADRRKKRDPLKIAEACDFLYRKYGSISEIATKLNVSAETIREFLKIHQLPDQVKHLIEAGLIQGMDIPYRISKIRDPQRQLEISRNIIGLPAQLGRDLIRLAERNPGAPISELRKRVLEAKAKLEPRIIHLVVNQIPSQLLDQLRIKCSELDLQMEKALEMAIQEFLGSVPRSLKLFGDLAILELDRDGYNSLRELGVNPEDLVQKSLEKWIPMTSSS